MKTLIINGSPRKNGDTKTLVNEMMTVLNGEVMVIDTYDNDIKPCMDCRYCWEHSGCSIQDGMQEVYSYIEACDNIMIASPIYYSELTGPLLSFASRLQTYFCGRTFRNERQIKKPKRGGVVLVGGGDGSSLRAYETASTLLRHMNARDISDLICSHNTNTVPAIMDEEAINRIRALAETWNT